MSTPIVTIESVKRGLDTLEETVENIELVTLGDRRNAKIYKESLQGQVETLKEQIDDLAKDVGGFKATLNRGFTWFLASVVGAAGLWVFNKLTGGP